MAFQRTGKLLHILAMALTIACSPEPEGETRAGPAMEAQSRSSSAADCAIDLVVDRSMTLDPACTYRSIRIVKSGVELDCAGATVDPNYSQRYGIVIGPPKLGELVRDVVLKNCTVKRARRHGIYISVDGCDADKLAISEAQRYAVHPQHIRLDNVTVMEAGNSGLYIDDYVQHVTVENSRFERNAGTAIYITHDARENVIRTSHFERNGYGEEVAPMGKGRREAIAIDSAQANRIENNIFRDNYAGAVFLYRNCWEQPENPCQVERRKGASDNIINGNDIEGGHTGVWIAARQRRSADQPNCGRKPDPKRGIFNDDAKRNHVIGNRFRRLGRAVVVEDDGNVVADNIIEQPFQGCIIAGSEQRTKQFGAPVQDLAVTGNTCRIGKRDAAEVGIVVTPGTRVKLSGNDIRP